MRDRAQYALSAILLLGYPAVILLALAVVIGGGGTHSPLKNLVVQLSALAAICWCIGRTEGLSDRFGKVFVALLIATIFVPLLHLIPMPPDLWQSLPGRDLALEARALVGAEDEWFPLTLDRPRTLGALASILVPVGLLYLLRLSTPAQRKALMFVVVGLAVANFVVGGLQVLLGNISVFGYPSRMPGRLYGFFANHNSSGLFFVLGLCALGSLVFGSKRKVRLWAYGIAAAMLVLGVILTQSRSSLGVLSLVLLVFGVRAGLRFHREGNKIGIRTVAGGLVALVLVAAILSTNSRISDTWERFETFEDARPGIWEDTGVAVDRYWPAGSGMGTFDDVFQVDESLENLRSSKAARAHNDYLELTLEAGVVGIIALLAWFSWTAYTWFSARKSGERAMADFSALALLCIALQSGIDYPLRNLAMLSLAACFVAVLASLNSANQGRKLD